MHSESISRSTWEKWLLDAVQKVKQEKQRVSIDRVHNKIRHHSSSLDLDTVQEQLNTCVKNGTLLKVVHNGRESYVHPSLRQLVIKKGTDMSKIIIKALRELSEEGGSTLKSIEIYIKQSFSLKFEDDIDLSSVLRLSAKRAVALKRILQTGRYLRLLHERKTPYGVPLSEGGTGVRNIISKPFSNKKDDSGSENGAPNKLPVRAVTKKKTENCVINGPVSEKPARTPKSQKSSQKTGTEKSSEGEKTKTLQPEEKSKEKRVVNRSNNKVGKTPRVPRIDHLEKVNKYTGF